ncbi:MAG: argininosuccinate synthase [Planctomycetales bacterium]|nr:argininosuccinate synthase [Planctomycetales bacterium]
MTSCVLAYSGGLDTSVMLGWLIEHKKFDVHAVYVDLGQPGEDREVMRSKAHKIGAKSVHMIDAREELCRDFAFPCLQWQAKYEGPYLMGTSIARPLITKKILEVADQVGAEVYAHGATGKGNDQCRFQLAAEALRPNLRVYAPWRTQEWRTAFPGRAEMISYCQQRDIPVKATVKKPYSSDENVLHISYEAGDLESLEVCGVDLVEFTMTCSPQAAPDKPEEVSVGFEAGIPVSVNGQACSALEVVEKLNRIGGRNGVGRIDVVENRFVGMKSRGVYEAPGMTILYEAASQLEQLTLDRDLVHLRNSLSPIVAEMVYYGYWFSAKFDALQAFIHKSHQVVTGEVTLRLYKGNMIVTRRSSPNSLYDEGIATMEAGGTYNQDDAEGFIRIQCLPYRVQGLNRKFGV